MWIYWRGYTLFFVLISLSSVALASDPQAPLQGEPLSNLTVSELLQFHFGKASFEHQFEEAEGLGPVFNGTSCADCHHNGGAHNGLSQNVTRFGFFDSNSGTFDPMINQGGSLLQIGSITNPPNPNAQCDEFLPSMVPGLIPENVTDERRPQVLWGAGLIDALTNDQISQNETIAGGRVHWVFEPGSPQRMAGRFGWKSQLATLKRFTGDALRSEHGITNSEFPIEDTPNGAPGDPQKLLDCDPVSDPEDLTDPVLQTTALDRITTYQRFLAPPPQWPPQGSMTGEALFNSVGCNDCHINTFTTPNDPTLPAALRNVTFHPYSDFLLHDMGAMADGIAQDQAGMTEMRTAPLWGVVKEGIQLGHNGSYGSGPWGVDQVVAAHGSAGASPAAVASATAYAALTQNEKLLIYDFLESLGQAAFDFYPWDEKPTIDVLDLYSSPGVASCYTAGGPFTADDDCTLADGDQDGDVDNDDLQTFADTWTPASYDCNCNDQQDILEVFNGPLTDLNTDGIPDECRQDLLLGANYSESSQQLNLSLFDTPSYPLPVGGTVYFYYSRRPPGHGVWLPGQQNVCTNLTELNFLGTATVQPPSYPGGPNRAYLNINGSVPSPANITLQAFHVTYGPVVVTPSNVEVFTIPGT